MVNQKSKTGRDRAIYGLFGSASFTINFVLCGEWWMGGFRVIWVNKKIIRFIRAIRATRVRIISEGSRRDGKRLCKKVVKQKPDHKHDAYIQTVEIA
jgi:hypothetical protein